MYKKSEQLLEQALHSIPLGSQTFSKSLTQYPRGVSPFFIDRYLGKKVKKDLKLYSVLTKKCLSS